MKPRLFFILTAVFLLVLVFILYFRGNIVHHDSHVESLAPQNGHNPSMAPHPSISQNSPSPTPGEDLTLMRKERLAPQNKSLVSSPSVSKPPQSQMPKISLQEWRELTDRIRASNGSEKASLIYEYLRIAYRSPQSDVINAILEALPNEPDPILLNQHVFLLRGIIDAEGTRRLVDLIDKAEGDPLQQNLYLRVMEQVTSPAAMPVLREIARSEQFTIQEEPLLFFTLRQLAHSGTEDDVRAIFDRINAEAPTDENKFSIMVTAAVEMQNPEALPFLLDVASGNNGRNSKQARLTAVWTLRNYRDNPQTNRLLNDLVNSSDRAIADAATEALTAAK